ncbi:helix-turn-helix domain-containing protein [Aridibaculum aurantiacum]|uniref:helix-turn-helix domain-containing protein n=1 Tax=Aridibaculum aurantiacum TaxID=2810307 RepID=UPI001A963DAC|nr:helix-turn-helix domain-containing protein [Aridibaculum aurantiacum]
MEVLKERQHIELIDKGHFEHRYSHMYAEKEISMYIEYCWESRFENLLEENPGGFSDVILPNIGYTYMINLGTPYSIKLANQIFCVKTGCFLPRQVPISAHHSVGNKIFGIKFKVCPIVFEKDVDFSDYKQYIYPLAYLIDKKIIEKIKSAQDFQERANIVFTHYNGLIKMHSGSLQYVTTVTEILKRYIEENNFNLAIGQIAEQYNISPRTLGRYFETTTGFSSKQALQLLRIRMAVSEYVKNPQEFDYAKFNYWDYSHFCKHLKQFTADHFHHFQQMQDEKDAACKCH